jgi:hypothetical protein
MASLFIPAEKKSLKKPQRFTSYSPESQELMDIKAKKKVNDACSKQCLTQPCFLEKHPRNVGPSTSLVMDLHTPYQRDDVKGPTFQGLLQ